MLRRFNKLNNLIRDFIRAATRKSDNLTGFNILIEVPVCSFVPDNKSMTVKVDVNKQLEKYY